MPDLPDWSQALPPHLLASGSTTPPGPTDLTVDLQGEQTLFIDASNPFSVDVVGATTGLIYPASVADGGTCYVPVSPVDDPTVDITLNDTLGLGLDYVIRGIPSDIRRLVLQAAVQDVILKAQAPAGSGTVLLSTDVNGNLLVAPYPVLAPGTMTRAGAVVTSGAVNTRGTTALIAAPGSGQRVRVWQWRLSCQNTAQTPARSVAQLLDAGLTTSYDLAAFAGFGAAEGSWPGGLLFPVNTGVAAGVTSDIAGLSTFATIYYTIE